MRRVLVFVRLGLLLTLIGTLVPLLDALADRIRAAYPAFTAEEGRREKSAIVIYPVTMGVVAIVVWSWTARFFETGRSRARVAATVVFLVAGVVSRLPPVVAGREMPTAYGALTLLPCVAGAAVVLALWTGDPAGRSTGMPSR
ncbi:hypothetical protein [Actinopolyspora saharensis]|uniref:hypothetical protein n=1 Tax=Actinopolyspora saharensis TaxID=995062 RepID=UPI0011141064|nr:hypothetical protein [Actinopolyspora saharensis]